MATGTVHLHRVLRTKPDGQIVAVTFGIQGSDLIKASAVQIHPGDVIAVEHTTGSWTRSLIAEIFQLQVNFFFNPITGKSN